MKALGIRAHIVKAKIVEAEAQISLPILKP
jgi:hypothetical protein